MKDEIRNKIKNIRNNIQKDEVYRKSKKIKKNLFNLIEFFHASTILFYISYNNEVFTHDMIKEFISMKKRIVVPKSDTKNNILVLSKLTDWNDLEIGAYNILEPKDESINEISIDLIDMIIVPGVVFDYNGNRIGHGKGYYDRLLKNSNCISIGLAYEFQLVSKIPAEEHDEKIDMIITEKRILKF